MMAALRAELAAQLGSGVGEVTAVGGGDINDAYRVRLADGRVVFVKTNDAVPDDLFAAEADGLEWLRAPSASSATPSSATVSSAAASSAKAARPASSETTSNTAPSAAPSSETAARPTASSTTGPRVPRVLGVTTGPRVPRVLGVGATWLALEWLELRGRANPARLGAALAELHRRGAPQFGYARANYLATLPQDNATDAERDAADRGGWPAFYVERRLRPLCRRARLGLDAQLDALRARPDRFGPAEPPARLHGDLWWGNVGALGDGAPVIFDPAVYGGHREIDLAMLALFGGLPDALIDAYDEVYPLADGWRERIALHQLYPLAAHACLFGGGYGAQVASSLRRFA